MGYSQVMTRSLAGVPAHHAHEASGVFNTVNMLGFVLGIATLGNVCLSAVGTPTPQVTGRAFETVALGCAVLLVAAVGLAAWLTRVEARGVYAGRPWPSQSAATS